MVKIYQKPKFDYFFNIIKLILMIDFKHEENDRIIEIIRQSKVNQIK